MLKVEQIAAIVHETIRKYSTCCGDHLTPEWETTPHEVREGTISGVQQVLARPGMTPEEAHASWMKSREKLGWKYGPKKSFKNKTHPCMVPYEMVSPEQRVKDLLFIEVVRILGNASHMSIDHSGDMESIQEKAIINALMKHKGNRTKAAKELKISVRNVRAKANDLCKRGYKV